MKSRYDMRGNIYLERDNGETVKLNRYECLEIFAALTDDIRVPFDNDLIYEQLEDAIIKEETHGNNIA